MSSISEMIFDKFCNHEYLGKISQDFSIGTVNEIDLSEHIPNFELITSSKLPDFCGIFPVEISKYDDYIEISISFSLGATDQYPYYHHIIILFDLYNDRENFSGLFANLCAHDESPFKTIDKSKIRNLQSSNNVDFWELYDLSILKDLLENEIQLTIDRNAIAGNSDESIKLMPTSNSVFNTFFNSK